jgi:hypothetical protein
LTLASATANTTLIDAFVQRSFARLIDPTSRLARLGTRARHSCTRG